MDELLKQRLVGAAVLVLLAVIFIPMILDRSPEREVRIEHPTLPARAEPEFSSRIVPLAEPRTPLVESEPGRQIVPESKPPKPAVRGSSSSALTAEAKPPATGEKPAPAPAPQPKATKEAEPPPAAWAIQLGSFSSAKNAIELRDKLKKMGYVAFIETAQVDGKEITRVFVGPELTKERAEELVKKLRAEIDLNGIIVQYPGS
jgi:DedD protein